MFLYKTGAPRTLEELDQQNAFSDKGSRMDLPPNYYDDVVTVYIRVIKQDSPKAAAAVEQIHATCGSRAALRATTAMTLLKMEVQQQHAIPDVNTYAYMFREYPEALPLLELAMKCWLQDRSIRDAELGIRRNGHLAGTDNEASSPTSDLPL